MAPINTINNVANTETLAALALQMAQGQVGQSEIPIGSNSGPMVNEYLKSAGLKPGYAWCQAFVYWCYEEAAKKMNLPNPAIRTAGVHECWNRSHASAGKTIVNSADALLHPELIKPGDQFILSFGDNTGHTGLVEHLCILPEAGGVQMNTIEGNSNNNGSREGYEVVRHERNLNEKTLLGFIKYS